MVPFGEKWESLLVSFKDDASLGKQKYDGGKRAAKAAQEARKLEKADAMFVTYCAELEDFAPRWLSLFRASLEDKVGYAPLARLTLLGCVSCPDRTSPTPSHSPGVCFVQDRALIGHAAAGQ